MTKKTEDVKVTTVKKKTVVKCVLSFYDPLSGLLYHV